MINDKGEGIKVYTQSLTSPESPKFKNQHKRNVLEGKKFLKFQIALYLKSFLVQNDSDPVKVVGTP